MADPVTDPNAPPAAPPAAPPPGAPPAAPPAGTPPAPTEGGGEPFATFHTKDQFDDRVERAARAKLRELGVDPEQARKDAEELAAMKAAEEKRRAAEMSELEKAQAEAEKAKAAALEAEQKAAIAAKDAETARLAAAHRVPDLEYLAFRLQKCPADADPHEWLGKLLEDETERVRFGVSDGAPAGGSGDGGGEKKKPTTTTTPKTGGAPTPTKTGGGGGDGGGEKTAMQMTRAEYEAHKRKKYGSGGQGVRKGYKPPPR